MIYFDTNVLVYSLDPDSRFHASAVEQIQAAVETGRFALPSVVLQEFYAVATDTREREQPLTPQEAAHYIHQLREMAASVDPVTDQLVVEAVNSAPRLGITHYGIYDHLIATMMHHYGVETLVTANDRDFRRYPDLHIIPLAPNDAEPQTRAKRFIPYGRQWIDEDDIAAVDRVLRSDYLTTGPEVDAFEADLASYTGARYCVAVSSATAALHIAVAALDLPAGSEGITSPNTFVASANCMVYNGLTPHFADIDPDTFNIDPVEIERAITTETRLLIPVHFAGRACDMERISGIARQAELHVIEDAAHAIGSRYPNGSRVGSCDYSDMTVFSFHPVKTMTTGEGGAITTNDEQLYRKLLMLRSHGITRDSALMTQNPGPWYYEMQSLGFNYRMTDIQAALGRSQLAKLDRFIARRVELVQRYHEKLSGVAWLTTPDASQDQHTCFHLYVVRIDWEMLAMDRTTVMNTLRDSGIGTQVLYIPVHTQPYYRDHLGYRPGDFPIAASYYNEALALPLFPAMTDADQQRVMSTIRSLA